MIGGLITIAGGTLASSGFIINKKPNAKELIDKLVPYTGWIGLVMFVWGVWETIAVVRHLSLLSAAPLTWIFWTGMAVADLLVGFILGFAMISKYVLNKNEVAKQKGQMIREKLVKIQVPLGFLAIVMGVLYTLTYFKVF